MAIVVIVVVVLVLTTSIGFVLSFAVLPALIPGTDSNPVVTFRVPSALKTKRL